MRRCPHSYVSINIEKNMVTTSGITWNEFYHGIERKPKGILLIEGLARCSDFCKRLSLDYIRPEHMETFSEEDVDSFGNFQWVDFEDVKNLSDVTDAELAEILFAGHMWEPLKTHRIDSLQNRFVYLSHDDCSIVRVYMNCMEDYKQVVNYKICKELKGRKRSIQPIQENVMERLYSMFQKGAVIDFDEAVKSRACIYQIGEVMPMDEVWNVLEQRKKQKEDALLAYDSKGKNWAIQQQVGRR